MNVISSVLSPAPKLRDVVMLIKPRITSLVLFTTAGGLWLAPNSVSWSLIFMTLIATTAVVASANTLNCWLERDVDKFMSRTSSRPLPSNRMNPNLALGLGIFLAMISIPVLALCVNLLTAGLGALALFSYVLIYTPLKQSSPLALIVGAVPGALPPLMGWTAATNSIDPPALVLFAILFLWQLPHFIAIAIFRKEEYERAGHKVLPSVRGNQIAKMYAALYAGVLVPVSLLLVPFGVAGKIYFWVASISGAVFTGVCLYGIFRPTGKKWARTLFIISLLYVTVLFIALIVDAQ